MFGDWWPLWTPACRHGLSERTVQPSSNAVGLLVPSDARHLLFREEVELLLRQPTLGSLVVSVEAST